MAPVPVTLFVTVDIDAGTVLLGVAAEGLAPDTPLTVEAVALPTPPPPPAAPGGTWSEPDPGML